MIYQIEASAVSAKDHAPPQEQLLGIIEPISGEVSITKVEPELATERDEFELQSLGPEIE